MLYKNEIINKSDLNTLLGIKDILFSILEKLYSRVFKLCQNNSSNDLTNKIDEIMNYYVETFTFFFNNGISPNCVKEQEKDNINQQITDDINNSSEINTNMSFIQTLLNTYFYRIIMLVLDYKPQFTNIKFYHYSNISLNVKYVMTPIYNNDNYIAINKLITPYIRPRNIKIIK